MLVLPNWRPSRGGWLARDGRARAGSGGHRVRAERKKAPGLRTRGLRKLKNCEPEILPLAPTSAYDFAVFSSKVNTLAPRSFTAYDHLLKAGSVPV